MTPTTYALLARERKAAKIADALQKIGITSDEAATATENEYGMAAELAGTKVPSAATWAVVVDMLRRSQAGALV